MRAKVNKQRGLIELAGGLLFRIKGGVRLLVQTLEFGKGLATSGQPLALLVAGHQSVGQRARVGNLSAGSCKKEKWQAPRWVSSDQTQLGTVKNETRFHHTHNPLVPGKRLP